MGTEPGFYWVKCGGLNDPWEMSEWVPVGDPWGRTSGWRRPQDGRRMDPWLIGHLLTPPAGPSVTEGESE